MITTFELAGLQWSVMPMGLDEQFEVECILLSTFGPAAGAAIAALVEGVAPALVEVLRDATGSGDQFDLAKLMSRPTAAEKLRDKWVAALSAGPVPKSGEAGPVAERWALVAVEAERVAVDVTDPDYADPQLQSAWGELLGALVVELQESIAGGVAFDVAATLLFEGEAAADAWEALASASLSEVVRETAGRGSFDLAGLMRLDTTDPRLRDVWEKLLISLATTTGDLVRGAIYALAGRLSVTDIKRLFELAVLSKKLMCAKHGNAYVTTYEVLNGLLRHDPRAKWDLLVKCLLATYSRREAPEGSGG